MSCYRLDISLLHATGVTGRIYMKNWLKIWYYKLKPNLPVLLVTGNPTFNRKKVITLGAVDLFYKPYDPEELVRIVQKTVASYIE